MAVGLIAIVESNGGTHTAHYTYTDHLGSILTVTNSGGTIEAEQSFDPWGRRRNKDTWALLAPTTVTGLPVWLYRGYTGHEHLDSFGLINMNGRLYDPVLGRMLSPDNYVQEPYNTQSYNRYSYVVNNPLKHVDPSGELFGTVMTFFGDLFETAFFKGGLDFTSKSARNDAWRNFDPTTSGTRTNLAWKIDMGAFKTDPERNFGGRLWTLFSRVTWEAPQSLLGNTYSHARNGARKVDNVDYWGGATLVNDDTDKPGWGLTLGSYINSENIAIGEDIFRHEYGHVLQSRLLGPLYFGHLGVPSFVGSIFSGFGWHNHNDEWGEIQANRMAFSYLSKQRPDDLDESKGGRPWDDTSGHYKRDYVRDWYYFLFPATNPLWWLF